MRILLVLFLATALNASSLHYDIVVYGGSSAGVVAAVQAARMGKSVALLEPSMHLGGMTSNGLSFVDVAKPYHIGGIAKEFFAKVAEFYRQDSAWRFETKKNHPDQHSSSPRNDQSMWTLEPKIAEGLFDEMVIVPGLDVYRGEKLNRRNGVLKDGSRIEQIETLSGTVYRAQVFIDATYEGDLMAAAGVSYRVGREATYEYDEASAGVRPNVKRGNIPKRVDPYNIKGDKGSGLLPNVYADLDREVGAGDNLVQAYTYRVTLTDFADNRIPIQKPENYNEKDYELVFRALEAGIDKRAFFKLSRIPNGKIDANNNGPVSMDFVGKSWDYAEADYETREKIAEEHKNWQRGLLWTLQHHHRIKPVLREFFASFGLAKDEFADNHNWPYQLYVREARRMVSNAIITENIALGHTRFEDAIGLGSYHIDSHAIKNFVADDGYLMTEGCLFQKLDAPYAISYRAIVPRASEALNLLVPVCLSATHVAYGSIRMEPNLMVLGQSAATAAALAIDMNIAVADLPYELLKERLLLDGQVLE